MLPLGGLFFGTELIPLFPELTAVMLGEKGGSSVGIPSGITGFR